MSAKVERSEYALLHLGNIHFFQHTARKKSLWSLWETPQSYYGAQVGD